NNTCTTGAAWQGPNCTDTWTSGNFSSSDYGPQLGAAIAPAASNTTYATVVTNAVNDWYATPSANYGLVLLAAGSDTGTVTFDARNQAGTEPRLLLTYRVPTAGGCSGTATLTDIADTYIQEDSDGNDNFGTDNVMKVRPQSLRHKHALLLFDVNGIPVGATINAATLKVYVSTNKTLTTSEIHRMVTAWTEGTDATNGAQWNDPNGTGTAGTWAAGAFGTADYNATTVGAITPSTKLFKTADVKSLVLGWQTGAFANNGLVLLTTGTATGDAAYASRENGTVANRPVINVTWTIPPSDPTRVNTVSAGPLLVVEGDKINVNMVLQNTTASAVTGVTPSALTVTASGAGAYSCATLTGPNPASQTVPANGSATFTWTCTTSTAPTVPGNLTFSATASGDAGATTFASSTSQSVIVTPPLTFKAQVNNPPGVNVATNQADMTLAFPATQGNVCYVMADGYGVNDVDYLRQVDRTTGAVTPATPNPAGTQSIEAMSWSLDYLRLYAVNANQMGTLDTTTGLFTAKPNTVASVADPMQGEFGAITVADVDGISFDPATGVLYGVSRREGTNTQLDVLIKIDPVTGKHINSAFGTGVD
ncbi:MAG: DNRLRE domain-containing protein, partial [Anaerolineae bacterium]